TNIKCLQKRTFTSHKALQNSYKRGHSQVIRPYNKYSAYKKTIFNEMVNTVRVKDTKIWEERLMLLRPHHAGFGKPNTGNPQQKEYKEKRVINSGCSRHITRNKCYLTDYEDYDGRFVSFGDGKGRISGKGKIKTGTLDFDDVYFWITREFGVARTLQQNGIAERKNKTLIKVARTMALVIKPHNKTPYELIRGRPP
nr:hypothetical protein [Tanacetum cinerariifolium]